MTPSPTAQSFAVSLQAAQKAGVLAQIKTFRRSFLDALRAQKNPTTAVVFVSGAPALGAELAQVVAETAPTLRALVVPAAGVLNETNEIEGAPAVAALVWSSGKPRVEVDAAALTKTEDTRLLFGTSEALTSSVLESATAGCLFGAGTSGDAVYGVDHGSVLTAKIVSLVLSGQGAPVVETSSACRTVAASFEITSIEGQMVLELDGRPALEVLSATVGGGKQGGLILVALESSGSDAKLFRPLKGIDPARRGIVVDATLEKGSKLFFAASASPGAMHTPQPASSTNRCANPRTPRTSGKPASEVASTAGIASRSSLPVKTTLSSRADAAAARSSSSRAPSPVSRKTTSPRPRPDSAAAARSTTSRPWARPIVPQ